MCLEHVGNYSIWHSSLELLPVLPILLGALDIISEGTMHEEDHQKDEVRVGQNVFDSARYSPAGGQSNLGKVMKMSS